MKLTSYKRLFVNIYNKYVNLKVKLEKVKFPEKLQGTVIEKWGEYWRNLLKDYYEVFNQTINSALSEKKNTFLILSSLGLFVYCVKSNPDQVHFRDSFISQSNKLIFVGAPIRNPNAVQYLKLIESNFNHGTIRRFSFGVFSVMWVDNYDRYLSIYKAMCPYLKPQLLKFHERIIDVGFCDKWWIMDDKLQDYDINPDEWQDPLKIV